MDSLLFLMRMRESGIKLSKIYAQKSPVLYIQLSIYACVRSVIAPLEIQKRTEKNGCYFLVTLGRSASCYSNIFSVSGTILRVGKHIWIHNKKKVNEYSLPAPNTICFFWSRKIPKVCYKHTIESNEETRPNFERFIKKPSQGQYEVSGLDGVWDGHVRHAKLP